MKMTIEATDQLTDLDGVPVRVWHGLTEGGAPCIVFVHRIAVHNDVDAEQFDRELRAEMPPGHFVDLRKIL